MLMGHVILMFHRIMMDLEDDPLERLELLAQLHSITSQRLESLH